MERDRELAALDLLHRRRTVIEGGAGIGKTALVRAVPPAAARGLAGAPWLGSELETGFAFGVVRQLFERVLAAADRSGVPVAGRPGRRGARAAGPPGAAPDQFAIVHGLYWLIVHLAAGQPVLIIVDDAHWADEPSLRWLAYLATRLDGLDAALVVALRPAEPASGPGPLAVRAAAAAIRPAVLTGGGRGDGPGRAGRGHAGRPVPGVARGQRRQPVLPQRAAARPGRRAGQPPAAGAPASEAVVRHVEARIRRLDPGALALAQALAVLGDGGRLRHAAAIAGLDMPAAIRLAADLVRVEVLAAADPPGFLHPIVRDAVEAAATATSATPRTAARPASSTGTAPRPGRWLRT